MLCFGPLWGVFYIIHNTFDVALKLIESLVGIIATYLVNGVIELRVQWWKVCKILLLFIFKLVDWFLVLVIEL